MSFSTEDLALLDAAQEVEIETQAPGKAAQRTVVWVVVDDGEAFVRTYKGAGSRWFRDVEANPAVAIHVGDKRLPASAIAATDPDSIERRVPASFGSTPPIPRPRRWSAPRSWRPRSASSPPDRQPRPPMYFDEFKHQLPDIDPEETARVARLVRPARRAGGREPRAVPRLQAAQAGPPAPRRAAAADPDALHQHDQPGAGAVLPGRRAARAPDPPDRPLERGGDGPAGEQQVRRDRRPSRDVRLRGEPVRGRVQPLLPGQGRRPGGRPDLLPGPRRARDLRPGVPRGPPDRGPARPLPAGDGPGRGAAVLPAPAADARLLGVPDGLDGHRADQRDLPGPLQPLPPEPRPARHVGLARLGVPRRRRDRRARVARRASTSRPARASTT